MMGEIQDWVISGKPWGKEMSIDIESTRSMVFGTGWVEKEVKS